VAVRGSPGVRLHSAAEHAAGDRVRNSFEIAHYPFPLCGATLCGLAGSC
jgi:hypothetical protein